MKEEIHSDNNFDFLRIIAATLVIASHSSALSIRKDIHFLDMSLGGFGVCIFFLISGYLITKSWISSPSVPLFFIKRFLRIMPALIVVTLFSVFIIGPFNTTLDILSYFRNDQTWSYFKNVLLYPIQYSLPGVFISNPYPNAVNGSLWSLSVEFSAYCSVAVLGFLGIIKKRFTPLIIILFLIFFEYYAKLNIPDYYNITIFYMQPAQSVKPLIYFFIGSTFYLLKSLIKIRFRYLEVLFIVWAIFLETPFVNIFTYLFLSYFLMFVAFGLSSKLSSFRRFGDPSYGMYVYAFPVQQIVIHNFSFLSPITLFLSSLVIILPIAFLSWYLVESPMLMLKKNFNKHNERTLRKLNSFVFIKEF